MNRQLMWRGLLVVLVTAGAVALILTRPPRLGLDLRGGSQIVLEAGGADVGSDAVDRTLEVLRRRVDQLGVAEPSLQRSGDRRIIVELPGVTDPQEAVEVIGKTAQLEFRPVVAFESAVPSPAPPETPAGQERAVEDGLTPAPDQEVVLPSEDGIALRLGPAPLTGDAVRDASAIIDSQIGGWYISLEFNREGSRTWAGLTGTAACSPEGDPKRMVAIVLDGLVILSSNVAAEIVCNEGITGGTTAITGGFSEVEAKDLSLLIRAGALPVPVEIVEQRTVGPTLGQAAIDASITAAIIGALLTMLYMVACYRLLGMIASIALLAYGVISFGVLLAINATLTLPGIAGFVLAIGMAVDANVLVFERMREEYQGKAPVAVRRGFDRAFSAIIDSNITTLLAAVLLIFLASGAVRGFGVTLSVGVVVSMFTALVVSRVLIELIVRSKALQARPKLLGLASKSRLKHWLEAKKPELIAHRKIWFSISIAAVVLASAGLLVRELNYGIEFTGGRLLEYSTEQQVNLNDLRSELAERGLARALVQESGAGNISVRTGQIDEAEAIDSAVLSSGGTGEKVRDEFVGPSIGNELRRKALIALGVALLGQLAYLAVRFRWNFGLAAVIAMFHDIVILLGLFAWMGKQLDGVFLAALLTVIGYSINDSVVVFDRIREKHRAAGHEPLEKVANDACLQTIPRTINTGLGALFILSALYFLGGDSLADFALALIIGIMVGTYSSVFTAAPICVLLDRWKPAPAPVRKRPAGRGRPVGSSSGSRARTTARKRR